MKYLIPIKRKAVLLSILCVAFLTGCSSMTQSQQDDLIGKIIQNNKLMIEAQKRDYILIQSHQDLLVSHQELLSDIVGKLEELGKR